VTADRRLGIGAWAALVAAFLGPLTTYVLILVPRFASVSTISLIVGSAQSIALLVTIAGIQEVLDHLASAVARAILAAGLIGGVLALLTQVIGLYAGPAVVLSLLAVASRVLLGVWLFGSAIAVGRGNGGRAASLGKAAGVGLVAYAILVEAGLFGGSADVAAPGWWLIIGVVESAYLVLLWRFVLAAVEPTREPA
jgi:hypothetical protein